jgi:hypothetical protein
MRNRLDESNPNQFSVYLISGSMSSYDMDANVWVL